MTSVILSRIFEAGRQGLLETVADDRLVDALDLDVHLQGGDAVRVPVTLKSMSPTESSLPRMSVDDEAAVRLADEAHRRTGHRCRDRHAGIHERQRRAAGRRHRRRAVGRHAPRHERITYGKSSWLGRTGTSARSARLPCPMSRRLGPRIGLFSPVLYGGSCSGGCSASRSRADGVDPLDVRGRAEGRDRRGLGLAAGEQAEPCARGRRPTSTEIGVDPSGRGRPSGCPRRGRADGRSSCGSG